MDETVNEIKRLQGCINDLISVLAPHRLSVHS